MWKDGGFGGLTDAARTGDRTWLVSCRVNLSDCTWRASQLCATGYEIIDTRSSEGTVGSVGPFGGNVQTVTNFQLAVSCK